MCWIRAPCEASSLPSATPWPRGARQIARIGAAAPGERLRVSQTNEQLGVGDHASWKWGSGSAEGKIIERFHHDVTRTIDGTEVTRKASPEDPAFVLEQADGQRVLKGSTELTRAD